MKCFYLTIQLILLTFFSWSQPTCLQATQALYKLPFPCGSSRVCSQGNCNNDSGITHKNKIAYAYDFSCPIGSQVVAMRAGTIIDTMFKFPNNNCPYCQTGCTPCSTCDHCVGCINDVNYLRIQHDDGTRALYLHLASNTRDVVTKGQYVAQGELIGYTGNTGCSSGPHLHVEVSDPNQSQAPYSCSGVYCKTIPFSFINASTNSYFVPKTGITYQSDNCLLANCTDVWEPNNTTSNSTNIFALPLNTICSNWSTQGSIDVAGDVDWYKVETNATGKLKIGLSGLPYNYDIELYGSNGLADWKAGSYQGGTSSELITFNIQSSTLNTYYIKVYGNTPNLFSPVCYTISVGWFPNLGSCSSSIGGGGNGCISVPAKPINTYGELSCPGTRKENSSAVTLTWTGNDAPYHWLSVSKYPYSPSNVVYDAPSCFSADSSYTVPTNSYSFERGMLYRWNMRSNNGDCSLLGCTSLISDPTYFYFPPEVFPEQNETIYNGDSILFSVTPVNPGLGSSVTYSWFKDGNFIGSGLTYYATTAGSYKVRINFTGSAFCNSTFVESEPVLILVTAIQNGLIGNWPFSGNANDISGNGNNGTIYGANLTTDRFFDSISAYSFNGVNSYVGIPTIDVSSGDKLSISVWVKPNNITSNQHYHIMRQDNGVGGLDWLLAFQDYGTHLSFGLKSGGNYSELDIPITASSYTNSWHHIVAVYDGVSRFVYMDNVLIGSDSKTGNVSYTPSATFAFGAPCVCSGVEKFEGKIDDISIWSIALSVAEIQTLYTSGNVCIPPPSTIIISPGTNVALGDTLLNLTPTFNWNTMSNSNVNYRLSISKAPYGISNLVFSQCVGNPPYSLPPGILQPNTNYRWDIQTNLSCGSCEGGYSSDLYFSTPNISQQFGQWTWMGGDSTQNLPAVYGTLGVSSSTNNPGARFNSISWTDNFGNFWLFGGTLNLSGAEFKNDLWKYNINLGEWTWIGGDSTINQMDNFSSLGSYSALSKPGARGSSISWKDDQGNLWLMGGFRQDQNNWGVLNDLWKYNIDLGSWAWMGGSNPFAQTGLYAQKAVFGSKGIPSVTNNPGGRSNGIGWIDHANNLWLFGGYRFNGVDISASNDLWKYNINSGLWTWMSGDSLLYQYGNYGQMGMSSIGNVPGCRFDPMSWVDNFGDLWLMGGWGYAANLMSNNYGVLNDLWKYSINSGKWTWMSGDTSSNTSGVFGTLGVPSATNKPKCRAGAFGWKDNSDNLWIMGGIGDGWGDSGFRNDLWKYNIASGFWTWMSGSITPYQGGFYGSLGIPSSISHPGARAWSGLNWKDNSGNLWLMGGTSDNSGVYYRLNDLWKYTPTHLNSDLNLELCLQGYYIGSGSMTATLMNEGVGTSSSITDTITVELKKDSSPYTSIASTKAILKTNGTAYCSFPSIIGSYYIVVRHRNGIETWSAIPVNFDSNIVSYDFTFASYKAYASNQVLVDNNTWAIYSGDINQDGAIDAFDYIILDPDIFSGNFGYLDTDLNGDGSVDVFDYVICAPNLFLGIGAITP